MRLGGDGVRARADCSHDRAFFDRRSTYHGRRAELQRRHGVAATGLDGDDLSAIGNGADEGDRSRRGGADGATLRRRNVDPTVLPACIGVGGQGERAQDGSLDGPRPGPSGWRHDERGENGCGQK